MTIILHVNLFQTLEQSQGNRPHSFVLSIPSIHLYMPTGLFYAYKVGFKLNSRQRKYCQLINIMELNISGDLHVEKLLDGLVSQAPTELTSRTSSFTEEVDLALIVIYSSLTATL